MVNVYVPVTGVLFTPLSETALVIANLVKPSGAVPTVVRDGKFRLFFFSREETRMHIHVFCPNGEAKFWIDPQIGFATSRGLNQRELNEIERIIRANVEEIRLAWRNHFDS